VTPAPAPKAAAVAEPPKPPRERVLQFYVHLLEALEQKDSFDILEVYLNALTQVYDPHSNYMAPASEEDFDISMRLTLQGIGAVLTSDDGYVKIVEIMPGGPADLDGRLQEGDRIVAVGQENAEPRNVVNLALNKVVRLIRGPKGTKVTLRVIPAGRSLSGLPVTIQLTRNEVKLTEQEAKLEIKTIPGAPDRKVAVIALPSFYADFEGRRDGKDFKSASRDIRRLLGEAAKQQVAGVVLDLRSDGGGSLDEAVNVAGLFFDKGPVVQVRDAERDIRVLTDNDKETVFAGPLVVLVNRLSASASEIVAAALQDYRRAVIIGDASTHGKGTVQTVYHLDELLRRSNAFHDLKTGSLKFTVAKFYRIDGGSTQRKGVAADIVFPSFADFLDLGETELPSALSWDEIKPVPVTPGLDVRPWLPTLLQRSKARLTKDADYSELAQQVTRFGELRKIKALPLNREKRELLQAEEDAFSKKVESLASGRRASARAKAKLKSGDEPAKPGRDIMLDESLAVIGDMLALQAGTLKPVPPPAALSVPVVAKTEKTP
jgi:carboxyl-terminal processing protease